MLPLCWGKAIFNRSHGQYELQLYSGVYYYILYRVYDLLREAGYLSEHVPEYSGIHLHFDFTPDHLDLRDTERNLGSTCFYSHTFEAVKSDVGGKEPLE